MLLCLQYIEVMLFKIYLFSTDVFQAVTNFILKSISILCLQILQEKAFERKQGEEDDVMIDYETMRFVYSD